MMIRAFMLYMFMLIEVVHAEGEYDISLKLGATSLQNSDKTHFENITLGLDTTYYTGSTIQPRLDINYVFIDDDALWDGASSLLQVAINGVYSQQIGIPSFRHKVYAFAGVGYEMVSGGHDKFDSLPFLQGGLGIAYGINKRIRILAEAKALQMMDGHGVSGDEENEFALFFGANILLNDIASPVPKRQFARRIVRKPARARTVVRVIEHLKKPTSTVPRPFKTIRSNRDGSVIDLGLQFSRKSAKFTADSKTKIKAFYRKFKRMPKGSIVTINAYTDNARSPRKSKNLSSKRAFALRKALIKLGARKRTVRAYGLGEKNPIADNNTPEGRVENERIELVILKKEKKK